MPIWPTALPEFVLREGYREGFKDIVIRSKMDTGAVKRRRRFSTGPEEHKFPIFLTSEEFDIFKEFYEIELAGGALSFQKIHPRTEIVETWAFTAHISPAMALGPDIYSVILPLKKLQFAAGSSTVSVSKSASEPEPVSKSASEPEPKSSSRPEPKSSSRPNKESRPNEGPKPDLESGLRTRFVRNRNAHGMPSTSSKRALLARESIDEQPSYAGKHRGTTVDEKRCSLKILESVFLDDIFLMDDIFEIDSARGIPAHILHTEPVFLDDIFLMDDIVEIDSPRNIPSHATYEFANGFDFEVVKKVRLTPRITASEKSDVQIWVRHTDEDPESTTAWSEFEKLSSSEFLARGFDFEMQLAVTSSGSNVYVTELGVDSTVVD